MGKQYGHFTLEERCTIARLQQAGQSIRQIATALDRSPSSVSRELRRNHGRQVGYKPAYAEEQAGARRWKGSRLDRDPKLRDLVLDGLRRGWSPEQVSGWLERQKVPTPVSYETIYRFIYAQIRRTNDGAWRNYLPRAKYKRGWRAKRGGSPASFIKDRVPIALRPDAVQQRRTYGHWEADLMLFAAPGQVILVAHERKSRLLLLAKQPSKAAHPTADQLIAWFQALDRRLRKTITFDNGTEFHDYARLEQRFPLKVYFATPYHSWERGSNENFNGLLRQYLPKGTCMSTVTQGRCNQIADDLNHRPRKRHGFKTPAALYHRN
jgi:transposase, IS30 family